jgi:hypothetical protein
MKKTLFLAIFLAFFTVISAQTRQQKEAVRLVEKELASLRQALNDVNNNMKAGTIQVDTLALWQQKKSLDEAVASNRLSIEKRASYLSQSAKLAERLSAERLRVSQAKDRQKPVLEGLSRQQADLRLRIASLEARRTELIDLQLEEAVNQAVPRELKKNNTKRRKNANDLRIEELGIRKLAATPVMADSIKGYKGLVWNQTPSTKVLFKLRYLNGREVDKGTFFLKPGEKIECYLLPGTYLGETVVDGKLSGTATVKSEISPSYIDGQYYHFFLTKTLDNR